MNQIVKDKMQREIMTVANKFLFNSAVKDSRFYPQNENDFEKIILDSYEYMVRGKAEENFEYKQPIPYGVIVDDNGKILVYKRGGSESNAGEKRLHNKIAIGVGGHIEKEDASSDNLLHDALIRELEEEVGLKKEDCISIDAIGYINNEEDQVSQVHFGIAYIIRINSQDVAFLDGEIAHGNFVTLDEYEKMLVSPEYDVESWSKIIFPAIKAHIS